MTPSTEITLDFDHSVGTEDRFVIKHLLEDFVDIINNQPQDELNQLISEAAVAEGFSEFAMQKPQLLDMFYKKFYGRRKSFIRFPKLKLSSTHSLFDINGEYEEYLEEILAAAGTIKMSLIKTDDGFKFVGFKFFPRMRMQIETVNSL